MISLSTMLALFAMMAHGINSNNVTCLRPYGEPNLKRSNSLVIFGNGKVPIAAGPNPFANNAVDGHDFLANHMRFNETEIRNNKRVSCNINKNIFDNR